MFAFRILVDIALKALSPAINDPTTGVLALDQMHRLLRSVGQRRLRGEVADGSLGHAARDLPHAELGGFRRRVVQRDPACGASNVQIARRLRAMLENLIATLPARRHARSRPSARGSIWWSSPPTASLRIGSSPEWRTCRALGDLSASRPSDRA